MTTRTKVLITGAAGRIGSFLTRHLSERYDFVLSDVRQPDDTRGFPFVEADIADLEAMRGLCQGVDTVVHLAADPSTQASWESLLHRPSPHVDILSTYERYPTGQPQWFWRVVWRGCPRPSLSTHHIQCGESLRRSKRLNPRK